MRLEDYDAKAGKKCWLDRSEVELLLGAADSTAQAIAFRLMARCGLRRQEVVDVAPKDIQRTDHGRVVRVWDGKGDKYREVPAPGELADVALDLGREQETPLISVADSTLWDWVNDEAQRCRAETGDEGWQFVGPHDLRRSWGVRALESGVLPSVVMEWGGWEDWQTFRNHYLAEFSPEALRRERGKVGWLAEGRAEQDVGGSKQGYAAVDPGRSRQY